MTDVATIAEPATDERSAAAAGPYVEVMGIRHHGPGSARAVRAALDRLQPDFVLIEGPADADSLTVFTGDDDLEPPIALLAYAVDAPTVAAFWPFAVFSPEWQALRWAAAHGAAVRFCDLPTGAVLAQRRGSPGAPPEATEAAGDTDDANDTDEPADEDDGPSSPAAIRRDPVAALASAAGYADPERWWDDVVESRLDAPTPFPVLTDAMTELRESAGWLSPAEQEHEDRREAYMRQTLRKAVRDGAKTVAVVCGAWHAPALAGKLPPATADARLLRGMPTRKTSVTWVPWSSSRLARASGYGAGIASPGWYHHLFTAPDHVIARWLVKVALVLRDKDLPVSSANVIEAVRLARTLAALRDRPLAGLEEVTEATRAVLCEGDETLLALVTRELVVGESLGGVPDSAPSVPLEADLRATARRLRLRAEAQTRELVLDLRKDTDLARSRLLHRLAMLGVHWGVPATGATRGTGTFRETWSLTWHPELAVDVVVAAMWGTTVAGAAVAKAAADAATATLPSLTQLVEQALVADLPDALASLLVALDAKAALDLDVGHLLDAIPPLVRTHRYSDVRRTGTTELARVADALLIHACAGLPAAVTGLDDDAATKLRTSIDTVHAAVVLREDPAATTRWLDTLHAVADRTDISGQLTGRITRLLRDADRIDASEAAVRLGRALSVGTPTATKAAWIEGFLGGGGDVLVHDRELLLLLDNWVTSLGEQEFIDALPLLRRTFGAFSTPERRSIAGAVRSRSATSGRGTPVDLPIDEELALPALATVAMILGGSSL